MKLLRGLFKKVFLPFAILLLMSACYIIFYSRVELVLLKETVENLDKWVFTLFTAVTAFILQSIAAALIEWYGSNVAVKTQTSLDDEFLPLLKKLTGLLIWVIALLMILSRFGINTNGLIAALGVSSLAIALAAQDTISNIISGFLIMVDRPFRINDEIRLPSGERVRVLEIGLRRSKFLAEDGAIIIVPNLDLSKSKIINYTYGKKE